MRKDGSSYIRSRLLLGKPHEDHLRLSLLESIAHGNMSKSNMKYLGSLRPRSSKILHSYEQIYAETMMQELTKDGESFCAIRNEVRIKFNV